MIKRIRKVAIIGQGLIGSSITRAIFQRDLPLEVTVTDASSKVRPCKLDCIRTRQPSRIWITESSVSTPNCSAIFCRGSRSWGEQVSSVVDDLSLDPVGGADQPGGVHAVGDRRDDQGDLGVIADDDRPGGDELVDEIVNTCERQH